MIEGVERRREESGNTLCGAPIHLTPKELAQGKVKAQKRAEGKGWWQCDPDLTTGTNGAGAQSDVGCLVVVKASNEARDLEVVLEDDDVPPDRACILLTGTVKGDSWPPGAVVPTIKEAGE